jgi:hypothetical protein
MDVSHQPHSHEQAHQSGLVSLPLRDEPLRLAITNGLAVSSDPGMNDAFVEKLSQLLHPVLANYHQKINDRLVGLDANIKSLSTRHLTANNDAVREIHKKDAQFMTGRLDRLEKNSPGERERKKSKSIEDRLKDIESSLSVLMKRVDHLESCRTRLLPLSRNSLTGFIIKVLTAAIALSLPLP